MKPLPPRISVIIPVYNHAQYLPEAIQSVLNQTLKPYEIIVVDDGSNDGSHLAAEAFGSKVKVLRQDHLGVSAARNLGISQVTGDFIGLIDADDLFDSDKFLKQMELFIADPQLQMAFCHVKQFLSPEIPADQLKQYKCPETAMSGIIPGALLIRRDSFHLVGEFDPNIQVGEFLDWYSRAKSLKLKEQIHPEVLYHRRIHGKNHGIRTQDAKQHYFKVLKANLDRRRKMSSN